MPKEKFYISGQVKGDGRKPDITVAWWEEASPALMINGQQVDPSVVDRLIRVLKRARGQYYGWASEPRGTGVRIERPDGKTYVGHNPAKLTTMDGVRVHVDLGDNPPTASELLHMASIRRDVAAAHGGDPVAYDVQLDAIQKMRH